MSYSIVTLVFFSKILNYIWKYTYENVTVKFDTRMREGASQQLTREMLHGNSKSIMGSRILSQILNIVSLLWVYT